MLIILLALYFIFIIRFPEPSFEKYVDLSIIPESELLEGVKLFVLFQIKQDLEILEHKIYKYNLKILDGYPNRHFLSKLREHNIPRISKGISQTWIEDGRYFARIFITKMSLIDQHMMTIEAEFQYAPQIAIVNQFSLAKNNDVWMITDFIDKKNEYHNHGLTK